MYYNITYHNITCRNISVCPTEVSRSPFIKSLPAPQRKTPRCGHGSRIPDLPSERPLTHR